MVTTEEFWLAGLALGQAKTGPAQVVKCDLVELPAPTGETLGDEDHRGRVTVDVQLPRVANQCIAVVP